MSNLDDHALQTNAVVSRESGNVSDEQPVMSMLWPLLGGNHTDADTWQEIDDAVRTYGDQRYHAAIDDVVANIRGTMCDCSGVFIANEITRRFGKG